MQAPPTCFRTHLSGWPASSSTRAAGAPRPRRSRRPSCSRRKRATAPIAGSRSARWAGLRPRKGTPMPPARTSRKQWSSPDGSAPARRSTGAAAALGLLELGCGRPESAIAPLEEIRCLQQKGWSDAALTPHRMPDLVEAYALAGRTAEAHAVLDGFRRDAERTRRPSALALAARCGAYLAADCEFDARFTEALKLHSEAGPFEHARTQLLYGSRLADAGRPHEASDHVFPALRGFEELGAAPWARRAREALAAAGSAAPPAQLSPLHRLTPLELEVALASADGG